MSWMTLAAAKKAKNDEFYTQWKTIENEINAYLEFDPDVFRGKTVLLPCDDPEWSNFTKFFARHFMDYGIKKLISTSYASNSNAGLPSYGQKFVLETNDLNGDGVNIDDIQWECLEGDGDFRSAEVTALRDEADIVITNPPFSLFREFVVWLGQSDVRFAIIGTSNAIAYKEVFPLIKENCLWLGATGNNSDMVFAVPKGTPLKESDREKAERLGYPSDDQYDYTRMGNSCWFTNIEHGRRNEPMPLMTMADNLKHSRFSKIRETGYRTYDNYDAIEVPYTAAIPGDYDGVMGVPISFLDKYNPDQFEIVGIAKAPLGKPTKIYPKQTMVSATGVRSQVTALNSAPAIKVGSPPVGKTYYIVDGECYELVFTRILIRPRNPEPKKD